MATRCCFLQEELSCPVCYDIFSNPVLLMCSHSICQACLQRYWEERGLLNCPVCMSVSSVREPPTNLVLRNLCESYLREEDQESGSLCSVHGERLRLFCLEDEITVCTECLTEEHNKHSFCHILEVSHDYKKEIKIALKALQEKLDAFYAARLNCDQEVEFIKRQAEHTGEMIKEVFLNLHAFLWEEEAARIALLKAEEEQKCERVKEMTQRIDEALSSLSEKVKAIEEDLEMDNILFIQKYKELKQRVQCTVQTPEVMSGVLINVAEHLGNLKYRVWAKSLERIKYTPVTLDPNTAHPSVELSDDLTSLRHSGRQELPDNPERFSTYPCVLGSWGFTCGRHQWDVEVGDSSEWMLGVVTASVQRKASFGIGQGEGLWTLRYKDGKYKTWISQWKSLAMIPKPQSIKVQLDYDKGEVSFLDATNGNHLFLLKCMFMEAVFPVFYSGLENVPLHICAT